MIGFYLNISLYMCYYKKVVLKLLCHVAELNDHNGFIGVNMTSPITRCLKK